MNFFPGLVATRDAIARGVPTPRAAIERCWDRAHELQGDLQAFAFLPDTVPEAGDGPLAGVAVAVKDLIDTADMPTAYGSKVFAGHRPQTDAAIVAALRRLGATVLGKSVTTEFAWQQPGPTRNPWNRGHTPGGSSSGSAAAVAAGIVPLALGTQTFGSVIRPAAFCGIVGFKPSFGTLPREGVKPLSASLDHVGLFARSIEDIWMALGHIEPKTGFPPGRQEALPRLRILRATDAAVTEAQRTAYEAAVATLRHAGYETENVRLPPVFDTVVQTAEALLGFEAAQGFGSLVARHGDAIGPAIRILVANGRSIGEDQYRRALDRQNELRAAHARLMQGYDVLLTIPAAGEAPSGLDSTGDARFCIAWSVVGAPTLTFPIGRGPADLPLGLQLVGRRDEDGALLRAGAAIAAQFPPVSVAPL